MFDMRDPHECGRHPPRQFIAMELDETDGNLHVGSITVTKRSGVYDFEMEQMNLPFVRFAGRGVQARILGLVAVVGLVAGVFGSSPAHADPASGGAQRQKADITRQRADLAAKIDTTKASVDEVAGALTAINDQVVHQQAAVTEAESQQRAAEAHLATLEQQLQDTQQQEHELKDRVARQMVNRYINPDGAATQVQLLRDDGLDRAEVRNALGQMVDADEADSSDELRGVEVRVTDLQHEADAARDQAAATRQAQQTQLDELQHEQSSQQQLKAALDGKLAQLHDDDSGLARQSAQLDAQIAAAKQQQAAAAKGPVAGAPAPAARATGTVAAGGSSSSSSSGSSAPSSGMIWPIHGIVTQEYGTNGHPGMDICAANGSPIAASASGTVVYATFNDGGYGNLVIIDHGNGIETYYAHQSSMAVSVGQHVSQGQVIGYEGSTGHSTGPHVHFEVHVNGGRVNPRSEVPGNP